jgi:hypothetical protein
VSDLCLVPHPEHDTVLCDKSIPCWQFHSNIEADLSWPGIPLPVKSTPNSRRLIADSAKITKRTGPAVAGEEPLSDYRAENGDWVSQAKQALHETAREHPRFTTGDVWPKLYAPPEKRLMVVAVRFGLAQNWMEEEGAVRENGFYETRDGVRFPLNKLVPIYKSLIYRPGR